jgi:hypothetical protein
LDFGLLLIIVFILAPLLEKLLGAGRQRPGQQPPVPPGGRPQQGRVPPSQRSRVPADDDTPFRSVPASHDDDESAASVLPDDLWEILTGERRAPRQDAPGPDCTAGAGRNLRRRRPRGTFAVAGTACTAGDASAGADGATTRPAT